MNPQIQSRTHTAGTTVLIDDADAPLLYALASPHAYWPPWAPSRRPHFPHYLSFSGTVVIDLILANDPFTTRATPLQTVATRYTDAETDIYLSKSPVSSHRVIVSFLSAGRSSRPLLGGDDIEAD